MKLCQSNRSETFYPVFCSGKKLNEMQKLMIWSEIQGKPTIPSSEVVERIISRGEHISVSIRQINRFRAEHEISREQGRPRGSKKESQSSQLVKVALNVTRSGVHPFDDWIEEQEGFAGIIMSLQERIEIYKTANPGGKFRLLYHRKQTLLLHYKALFYAPLFDIGKLIEYDYKVNPLQSVIGRSYQSSTLNQFLGQLERIQAGELFKATPNAKDNGEIGYVDGVMTPFWTKQSMHKGYITMLGRIMAGSQAVITHNAAGYVAYFSYFTPDSNLSPIILDYCKEVHTQTGIEIFVIDRAVNSTQNAADFQEAGLGLLCMLDKNEYSGLESFEADEIGKLKNGSVVYQAKWKVDDPNDPQEKKNQDKRVFVVVWEEDRPLVYWGNQKVKDALPLLEWPEVYRARVHLQETSFKGMIAHGKLKICFGIKKIWGPDRHQERKKEVIETKIKAIEKRIEKKTLLIVEQTEKVEKSEEKSHTKLLPIRQKRLCELQKEKNEISTRQEAEKKKLDTFDEAKERADRDTRKQEIMTARTLILENFLVAFWAALSIHLKQKVSFETLIALFFNRSGSCTETPLEKIYWIDTQGLSVSNELILGDIVQAVTAMNIKCRGKTVRVRMKRRGS